MAKNWNQELFPLHTPKQIKIKTRKAMIFVHPLFSFDIKPVMLP